jgi:integrase
MKQARVRYQKGCLTKTKREGGREVWVFRWRETCTDGTRRSRKLVVGSVDEFPTERRAWQAVDSLRLNINAIVSADTQTPRTVMDLIRHCESTELADDSDTHAFSSRAVYKLNLKNWIEPQWGRLLLGELEELPGVYVESWLKTLPLATGTKAKIRNTLSALCSHALRYGWMKNHPIKGKVRQSAKTTREQEALEVEELQALLAELAPMYRLMVVLAVLIGLRRGELFAAQWCDLNFVKKTLTVFKSIWHQHLGPVKTKESERVMPLHDDMIAVLSAWREQTTFAKDEDWVFASSRKKGKQPLWPEGVLENHIQPAAKRAGIIKRVTWHTFRHTFSTLLVGNEVDVKTAQSLLRHANPAMTLGVYAHALDRKKREAQSKLVEMVVAKKLPMAEQASA